jgi:hypothetical protein
VLAVVLWQQGRVASRNGTGPRVYFLAEVKAEPTAQVKPQSIAVIKPRDFVEPLSFSTLHLPTTPLIRGDRFIPGGTK